MDIVIGWILESGIKYLLYFILLFVTIVTVKEIIQVPIKGKVAQLKHRARLRKKRANEKMNEAKVRSGFFRHLHLLLRTTSDEDKENDVFSFIFISALLFISTFGLLTFNFGDLVLALFVGILAGVIPYLILQVRLKNMRNSIGNELTPVVGEFTQQYNAHNYDMYRTLMEVSKGLKQKTLRRVFIRLISDLQTARSDEDRRLSIETFIYTCGNSWAKRLGNIILKGYYYDENVMNALLTLNKQMEETEKMLEEEKSFSFDPVVNGFVTVPVFVAAIFLSNYVSGPQDWFNLQFNQSWSLLTFILALSLTIVSVFISLLLRNPKNDL